MACSISLQCIMVSCQVKPSYIDLFFYRFMSLQFHIPYVSFFALECSLIYIALWWVIRWSRIQAYLSAVYFIMLSFPLHQFLCISCYLMLLFTIINDEDSHWHVEKGLNTNVFVEFTAWSTILGAKLPITNSYYQLQWTIYYSTQYVLRISIIFRAQYCQPTLWEGDLCC